MLLFFAAIAALSWIWTSLTGEGDSRRTARAELEQAIEGLADPPERGRLQIALERLADDQSEGVAFAEVFLRLAAGGVAVVGLVAAFNELRGTSYELKLAKKGQITERFSRGIEHLGSTEPDLRIGGVYTLHAVAVEAEEFRPAVREVLATFVRQSVGRDLPSFVEKAPSENLDTRAPHVQAALRALGRIGGAEPKEVALYRTDLRRASFRELDLAGVNLSEALLGGSHFGQANLRGADLTGADMTGAKLFGADLRDTERDGAVMRDIQVDSKTRPRGLAAVVASSEPTTSNASPPEAP